MIYIPDMPRFSHDPIPWKEWKVGVRILGLMEKWIWEEACAA